MSQAIDSHRNTHPPSANDGPTRFPVEDRFRLLVDAVTDYAIFMLDPAGIVFTWNVGAERIKGYQAKEIVGRHFSVFYPPEAVAAGVPQQMLAIAATDGRCVDEGWRVRKDGSLFWASVVLSALHASDGTLIGFGKVTRDLTERRAAEEALRAAHQSQIATAAKLAEANAYVKNVFNASTLVAMIATDLKRTITAFNPGAERMLVYNAAEIVGLHTPSLFHLPEEIEDRARALSAYLKRPIHGAEFFRNSVGLPDFERLDWTYLRKDGKRLSVMLSLSLIRDEEGEPIGYLGVAENITEQRSSARKLTSAHAQLNSVLECTSDCVMNIARNWTILYGNRRTLEMLPDFQVGRNYWECFPAVLDSPSEALLRGCMHTRTEASYESFFEPYKTWFKVRIYPSDEGISAFFSDITEEKNMQEQIAREQMLREKRIEALSHMAGGLAHEISNPLAIIHARASDLKYLTENAGTVPASEVAKASQSIVHTADRAMRILRGLRGFGREAGSDPMEWASIEEIVAQCVELQQSRFERHNIRLGIAVHPDLPLILCRETQIGQILTNLLNNAFDAVEQSGVTERWVKLNAEADGQTIVIHVTDSGPDIDKAIRPYLMDPFFTTKSKGLGTGIGLSLSRAIAQEHGGSLALCDRFQTTCFELILPLDSTDATPD